MLLLKLCSLPPSLEPLAEVVLQKLSSPLKALANDRAKTVEARGYVENGKVADDMNFKLPINPDVPMPPTPESNFVAA